MNICFIQGDITGLAVDAIVLPANSELKEGSGASEAIFKAAGRAELAEACREIGGCDIGSAVVTNAFHLDANYIVHACVPKWIDGQHHEYDLLGAAYISAMKMADMLNCDTIAFPLLASGNNRFDKDVAFSIAVDSISKFQADHLKQAVLVLYGDNAAALANANGYPVIGISTHSGQVNNIGLNIRKNASAKQGQILNQAMQNAMAWMKKKENQKMMLDIAMLVVEPVLEKHTVLKSVVNVMADEAKAKLNDA